MIYNIKLRDGIITIPDRKWAEREDEEDFA